MYNNGGAEGNFCEEKKTGLTCKIIPIESTGGKVQKSCMLYACGSRPCLYFLYALSWEIT